jgi:uncharacterized protein
MPRPAIRAGQRASHGEVVRLPGDHYAPFMDGFEQAVELQLAFLRRHLMDAANPPAAAAAA